MTAREQAVGRVRKLLELGRGNSSAQEATAAVLAAQRLIVRYGIGDDELRDTNDDVRIVQMRTRPLSDFRTWRWPLAVLVARSFRCRFWQDEARRGTRRLPAFVFYGYELDAQAAMLAYERLYATGNRLARRRVRALSGGASTAGAYNSYITGFLAGVTDELERQSRELMVVVPRSVSDRYEAEVEPCLRDARVRGLSCDMRMEGLIRRGIEDGRDAVRSRRLGSRPALDGHGEG